MAYINTVKKNNATILLADGGDIGAGQVSWDLCVVQQSSIILLTQDF